LFPQPQIVTVGNVVSTQISPTTVHLAGEGRFKVQALWDGDDTDGKFVTPLEKPFDLTGHRGFTAVIQAGEGNTVSEALLTLVAEDGLQQHIVIPLDLQEGVPVPNSVLVPHLGRYVGMAFQIFSAKKLNLTIIGLTTVAPLTCAIRPNNVIPSDDAVQIGNAVRLDRRDFEAGSSDLVINDGVFRVLGMEPDNTVGRGTFLLAFTIPDSIDPDQVVGINLVTNYYGQDRRVQTLKIHLKDRVDGKWRLVAKNDRETSFTWYDFDPMDYNEWELLELTDDIRDLFLPAKNQFVLRYRTLPTSENDVMQPFYLDYVVALIRVALD